MSVWFQPLFSHNLVKLGAFGYWFSNTYRQKWIQQKSFESFWSSKMRVNLGEGDSLFRILIGTVLIALACTDQIGALGWIAGPLLVLSGTLGFCAIYAILGFRTCQEQSAHWDFYCTEHWIEMNGQNSSTWSPLFKLEEQVCNSIETDWPLNINL